MSKLIAKYKAVPTTANRARLTQYLAKHSMAICMSTADEMAFLKCNGFAV